MPTSIPANCNRAAEHGFTSVRRSAELGFTPVRRSAEHGFTLVELMVVIAIIGFVSAAVVIAMPDPRGRVIEDADRFAGRLLSARDQAIIQARPIALWVSPTGYGFEQRRDGAWTPLDDKPFSATNWREGTVALVGQVGRAQISFDSTGLPTDPLAVKLVREGAQVSVTVDMGGKVTVSG